MTKLMILLSLVLAINTLVMSVCYAVLPKYMPDKSVLWRRIYLITLVSGFLLSLYLTLHTWGFIGAFFA